MPQPVIPVGFGPFRPKLKPEFTAYHPSIAWKKVGPIYPILKYNPFRSYKVKAKDYVLPGFVISMTELFPFSFQADTQ